MAVDPTLDQGHAEARQILRAYDPDRYFATLFAPESRRDALVALHAFDCEIARIRRNVSEPLPGEVRIQWWRDTIESGSGESLGHPLARSLFVAIERYALPKQAFLDLLDARIFDLYDDLMPSWSDLEGYCGETSAALVRLSAIILADGMDPGAAEACGHAGVAIALTQMLRLLSVHARQGQVFLPEEALKPYNIRRADLVSGYDAPELRSVLQQARQRIAGHLQAVHRLRETITPELRPAFLPLACLPLYLKQMERRGYQPFTSPVALPDWRRIWAMLRWKP